MRLIKDVILFTTREMPKWNPMNVCSYHLQEAGATPVQELAFALATAIAVLDTVKASGEVRRTTSSARWSGASRSSSMPACASSPRSARCAPSPNCGTRSPRERYGVTDPKQRLFRYGVQVNSLGLTEQQPENNVYRILLEMLAVTLSKNARARAVQLPAWNEALGLPRPWDQQWSLRMQQILAYETDLLEYGDIFDGSPEIAAQGRRAQARGEGGARAHRDDGRRGRRGRERLHEAAAGRSRTPRRLEAIERGEQVVVGVNRFSETEPSPLTGGADAIITVSRGGRSRADRAAEGLARSARRKAVAAALKELRSGRASGRNIMPASIACAKAGVTTGEWGCALREAFGEYRAPTGVGTRRAQRRRGPRRPSRRGRPRLAASSAGA